MPLLPSMEIDAIVAIVGGRCHCCHLSPHPVYGINIPTPKDKLLVVLGGVIMGYAQHSCAYIQDFQLTHKTFNKLLYESTTTD